MSIRRVVTMSALARVITGIVVIGIVIIGSGAWPLRAQQVAPGAQMPDAKQMSGIPLPVGDLAVGTVTVRVVRGTMANVVADHPVELSGGSSPTIARTNESGRAEFSGLRPGMRVTATTTVDGERLASQEFTVPATGGVRVALVATAPQTDQPAAGTQQPAQRPAQPGSSCSASARVS